jgi:ubiquinone/menaquinone biosynthesis C-methylase UbiE
MAAVVRADQHGTVRPVQCFFAGMERAAATWQSAKAQVEALFDSLAAQYVREREREFSFLSQKRIVVKLLEGVHGRLLEVGCGPAVMLPDLLAAGFEVQGIDVSGEMIRRARQRMAGHPLEKRCRLAVGDVERLHFSDACFDAVLCMGVLEYLPRYGQALAEISRVLRPGGVAVLTVPNRASAYHAARAAYQGVRNLERRLRGRRGPSKLPHNRCLPWRLDRELAAAGLAKLESRACNFIFFPLQELLPGTADSLNRALTPLSASFVAPVLGAQYIVKAHKTLWRSVSSA